MKPTPQEMMDNLINYLENNPDDDSIFKVDSNIEPGVMKFTDEQGNVLVMECEIKDDKLIFGKYYIE